jgi:hypothetical protein
LQAALDDPRPVLLKWVEHLTSPQMGQKVRFFYLHMSLLQSLCLSVRALVCFHASDDYGIIGCTVDHDLQSLALQVLASLGEWRRLIELLAAITQWETASLVVKALAERGISIEGDENGETGLVALIEARMAAACDHGSDDMR